MTDARMFVENGTKCSWCGRKDTHVHPPQQYHHVGTGVTTSAFWCKVCEGFYGVPHDGDTHKHRAQEGCACAPCQKASGRYGSEGVFMEHERYLAERAAGVVHSASRGGPDE